MENTNARYLESLDETAAIAVIDVSFISLRLILPALARLIHPASDVVALVKPQFEAGRSEVGKGGIIRDLAIHRRVLKEIAAAAVSLAFAPADVMPSPITGAKGNVEYLMRLRSRSAATSQQALEDKINALTSRLR